MLESALEVAARVGSPGSNADSDDGADQEADDEIDRRTVNSRIVAYREKCRFRIRNGKSACNR
jgi:hypothetical protein